MTSCSSCKRNFRVENGVYKPTSHVTGDVGINADIARSVECLAKNVKVHGNDSVVAKEAYELSKMVFHQDLTGPVRPTHFDVIRLPVPEIATYEDVEMMEVTPDETETDGGVYMLEKVEFSNDDVTPSPPKKTKKSPGAPLVGMKMKPSGKKLH